MSTATRKSPDTDHQEPGETPPSAPRCEGHRRYGGAFTLGLVSGLIAAPCSGPVTIGMMTYIGKSGNVALGALVGFTFSLGLGLPTWVVGTFAASLPKGGKWMV